MSEQNTLSAGSIQIFHVNNNHWITLSTLQSPDCDHIVMVFDSLNSCLTASVVNLDVFTKPVIGSLIIEY